MVFQDMIRKFTLQNAIRYNGKANPGNVLGKILGGDPALRAKAKEVKEDIAKVVEEVNKMSLEEQTKELQNSAPEMLEKKEGEKKTDLKDLENAEEGKVVLRIEPSPSGRSLSQLVP